jgi:glycosyltransferase involved in cell wall biosynthesis
MFSLVVPCYKAMATIRETLDSALSQDCELEVIAVNDGSPDDTLEILQSYGSAIKVLDGPNRGVSAARNWGLETATGDWVVFLDQDDLLEPGTLLARRQAAERTGADVVLSGWTEYAKVGGCWRRGRTRFVDMDQVRADAELVFARDVLPPPACILYRRTLAQDAGGFHVGLPVVQDVRFLFDCARHGARFAGIEEVGALYRVHPAAVSRSSAQLFWTDVMRNMTEIERLWQSDGALTTARLEALAETYNTATKQLCRAGDPAYREPLLALRRLDLPVWRRNQALDLLARAAGPKAAGKLARLWKAMAST